MTGAVGVQPETLAVLDMSIGVVAADPFGLMLELDAIAELRLSEGQKDALERLTSCHAALLGAVNGREIRASAWTAGAAGRIRAVGPCLQNIPRRVRPYLRSALSGHSLVDVDYEGAHGAIAAALAHADHEAWVYTADGRQEAARAIGWRVPTPNQLRAIKGCLLAFLTGGAAARVHRDFLAPHGASLVDAQALLAWWETRTPCIQARVVEPERARVREWRSSGGREPLVVQAGGREIVAPPHKLHGGRLVALRLQAEESRLMERVLRAMPNVSGAYLVAPMYDGILISAATQDAERVARHVADHMESAARGKITTKLKIAPTWPV